jgi:general stress protein YciG
MATEDKNRKKGRSNQEDKMTVQEAGQKGVETLREKYGPDAMAEIGHKGGEARKEQLGSEGYSELGHKGGQRVKELIEEGKEAEQSKEAG